MCLPIANLNTTELANAHTSQMLHSPQPDHRLVEIRICTEARHTVEHQESAAVPTEPQLQGGYGEALVLRLSVSDRDIQK